jgi:hypothetical protein
MLTADRKKEYLEKQKEEMEMGFFRNEVAKKVYESRLKLAQKDNDKEMIRHWEDQIAEADKSDLGNQVYVDVIDSFLKDI